MKKCEKVSITGAGADHDKTDDNVVRGKLSETWNSVKKIMTDGILEIKLMTGGRRLHDEYIVSRLKKRRDENLRKNKLLFGLIGKL